MACVKHYETLTKVAALLISDSGYPPYLHAEALERLLEVKEDNGLNFLRANQDLAQLSEAELEEAVIGDADSAVVARLQANTDLVLEYLFDHV